MSMCCWWVRPLRRTNGVQSTTMAPASRSNETNTGIDLCESSSRPCDDEKYEHYCDHGQCCLVLDDEVTCACYEGFTGPRCDVNDHFRRAQRIKVVDALTVISVITIVVVVVFLIVLAVCYFLARRKQRLRLQKTPKLQQLPSVSTAPGQQPGFSWCEVTIRRQQSCQSAPRGSISRPLSAPPDTLSDVAVVTSPLPSNGEAVDVPAAAAEGATSDASDHAPSPAT